MSRSRDQWWKSAACVGVRLEVFFPTSSAPGANEQALSICAGCPVRDECLTDAMTWESLDGNSRHGVFGGTTPRQRKELSRPMTTEEAA